MLRTGSAQQRLGISVSQSRQSRKDGRDSIFKGRGEWKPYQPVGTSSTPTARASRQHGRDTSPPAARAARHHEQPVDVPARDRAAGTGRSSLQSTLSGVLPQRTVTAPESKAPATRSWSAADLSSAPIDHTDDFAHLDTMTATVMRQDARLAKIEADLASQRSERLEKALSSPARFAAIEETLGVLERRLDTLGKKLVPGGDQTADLVRTLQDQRAHFTEVIANNEKQRHMDASLQFNDTSAMIQKCAATPGICCSP